MEALSKDTNVPKDANLENTYLLNQIAYKMRNDHLTAGQAWKQYQWDRKLNAIQDYGAMSLCGFLLLALLISAILFFRWIGRMIRTAANRGRYQIQKATPEGCYVLDTTTGDVTWKPINNQ